MVCSGVHRSFWGRPGLHDAPGGGAPCPTARERVSVLETSYLATRLLPHHRNFGKRLVKTPKLYFLDTGLMAWLKDQ